MIELEQHTCGKCGQPYTEPPLSPGYIRLFFVCPTCKPPPDPNAPAKITFTQVLVAVEKPTRPLLTTGDAPCP